MSQAVPLLARRDATGGRAQPGGLTRRFRGQQTRIAPAAGVDAYGRQVFPTRSKCLRNINDSLRQ